MQRIRHSKSLSDLIIVGKVVTATSDNLYRGFGYKDANNRYHVMLLNIKNLDLVFDYTVDTGVTYESLGVKVTGNLCYFCSRTSIYRHNMETGETTLIKTPITNSSKYLSVLAAYNNQVIYYDSQRNVVTDYNTETQSENVIVNSPYEAYNRVLSFDYGVIVMTTYNNCRLYNAKTQQFTDIGTKMFSYLINGKNKFSKTKDNKILLASTSFNIDTAEVTSLGTGDDAYSMISFDNDMDFITLDTNGYKLVKVFDGTSTPLYSTTPKIEYSTMHTYGVCVASYDSNYNIYINREYDIVFNSDTNEFELKAAIHDLSGYDVSKITNSSLTNNTIVGYYSRQEDMNMPGMGLGSIKSFSEPINPYLSPIKQ